MKPLTRIRSSSALWVAPVVLLLMFAYYFTDTHDDLRHPLGYAPTVVDAVLRNLTPAAYAVAAALGAWEARKLGSAGVWQWGAVRSRYVIAADSLLPVVGMAWLMLILPTATGLIETGTPPDPASIGLVAVAMLLTAAHAVIGFAAGVVVRHIAVVPVIAVLDWLASGSALGLTIPWPRHLTGIYGGKLVFGELPTVAAIVAPLLLAVGCAVAVALLWSRLRKPWVRAVLAGALALGSAGGAYSMIKDYGYIGPRSVGHGEMACDTAKTPRICVPTAFADALPALREDTTSTLRALREAGIEAHPETLTDAYANARYGKRSTATDWHVPLAASLGPGTTRYQIARAAVGIDCPRPATEPARQAYYWISMKAGVGDTYLRRLDTEPDFTPQRRARLRSEVADILEMSDADQTRWFRRTEASACEKSGERT
ncbi:DUF7224 domain-containing protein [Streptomyces sp. NPDC002851]